jgi:hypothetical protein
MLNMTCHCGEKAEFVVELADEPDLDTDPKTTGTRVCPDHLGGALVEHGDRVVVVWRADVIGSALWSARWLRQQGWREP